MARNPYGPSPFDDPFFGDPFSAMRNMMGNMDRMMGGMFNDPFFTAGFGSSNQVGFRDFASPAEFPE